MNLAIVGSLDWDDHWSIYQAVMEVVSNIVMTPEQLESGTFDPQDITIISGGARGADTIAANIARGFGMKLIEHLPEWNVYGNSAGHVRNQLIVDDADLVLAFKRRVVSAGTQSTINKAQKSHVPFVVWTYEEALGSNPGTMTKKVKGTHVEGHGA